MIQKEIGVMDLILIQISYGYVAIPQQEHIFWDQKM